MRRLSALLVVLLVARPVLAHETRQPHTESSPVPPVVLLAGLFVLGTALYLDHRDALSRRLALFGIGVGIVATGIGAGLFLT
jgi:hypothetical protein